MKIYDITRKLDVFTPAWPGDEQFSMSWTSNFDSRDICNISKIKLSTHVGTHLDSPFHVLEDGATIDQIPLSTFIGPAFVVEIIKNEITYDDIKRKIPFKKYKRILFKTNSNSSGAFNVSYTYFTKDAAKYLAEMEPLLIGTDAPSVDKFEDKEIPIHKILCKKNIVLLENANLENVPEGEYMLYSLPLNIIGAEASPVRAVLIK